MAPNEDNKSTSPLQFNEPFPTSLNLVHRYLIGEPPPPKKQSWWTKLKFICRCHRAPESDRGEGEQYLLIIKSHRFGPPLHFKRNYDILRTSTCYVRPWDSPKDAVVSDGRAGDRSVRRALLVNLFGLTSSNSDPEPTPDGSDFPTPENRECPMSSSDRCFGELSTTMDTAQLTSDASIAPSDVTSPIHVAPVAFKFIRPDSSHVRRRNPKKHPEAFAIYKEALCYRILCKKIRNKRLRKPTQSDRWILGPRGCKDWQPMPELVGDHLNKEEPGQSVIVTRLLSGPDIGTLTQWDMKTGSSSGQTILRRLWWCILILRRIYQIHSLGIRHNDIKPANFVIDLDWDHQLKLAHEASCESAPSDASIRSDQKSPIDQNLHSSINQDHHEAVNRFTSDPSNDRPSEYCFSAADIKLIDFGCATPAMYPGFAGGTPAYLSPELVQLSSAQRIKKRTRHRPIDQQSDLWSAGIVLIELLTARPLSVILNNHPPRIPSYGPNGWTTSPLAWTKQIRRHLIGKVQSVHSMAAQRIFDCFLKVDPDDRGTIDDGIRILFESGLQLKGITPNTQHPTPKTQLPMWLDEFFLTNLL